MSKVNLNLVTWKDRVAVCRLSATAPIPPWISLAASTQFLSITRTADELSIVCSQEVVPSSIQAERDWLCIKVQGPLDFELTGILATLATTLAKAQISIFAISTYDTDYLLVKETHHAQAIAVLKEEGHSVTELTSSLEETPSVRPQDGPAQVLEADTTIAPLVELDRPHEATFGLVVVAGWPPQRDLMLPAYAQFRAAVELCFDESDTHSFSATPPAVYLYPYAALHVTVATFQRFMPASQVPNQAVLETKWRQVFQY